MSTQVLVLDQSCRPHNIVGLRKAIGYLVKGKAEVVEEYDEEIRAMTLRFKVPAVLRLLNRITARDNFSCQYCGTKHVMKDLTFDHVVPRVQGGKTTWENIVAACRRCNNVKGPRTPEQAGMPLLSKPKRPWSAPEIYIRLELRGNVPDLWATHLYWHSALDV
jgi:5-methylcytosine-specific restriction endonuclease McrA